MTDDSSQFTQSPNAESRRRRGPATRGPGSAIQAISDPTGRTIGYELFYRDSQSAETASEQTTSATLQVLASHDVPSDGGSSFYFVNVTRDFLVGNVPLPDPTEVAVLEVQPDVLVDGHVLDGAMKLRERGYGIALDRYTPHRGNRHDLLLPFASHVKLDFDEVDDETLRQAMAFVRASSNALVVGTKIGSAQRHDVARQLGCDLFQGWEVEAVKTQNSKAITGTLARYIELLEVLAGDDAAIDIAQVVVAVMRDADLSMRVLRACNSASTALGRPITSIRQAIVLLGVSELRRRVHLAVAQGLGVRDGEHLVELVEYAALAELVGLRIGMAPGSGFLVGLLSQVAEAIETPIEDMLKTVPIAPELAASLRGRTGRAGDTMVVVDAYKRAEEIPAVDGLTLEDLRALHAEAMLVATGLSSAGGPDGQESIVPVSLPPVWSPPESAQDDDGAVVEAQLDGEAILGQPATAAGIAQAEAWGAGYRDHARLMLRQGSVPLATIQETLGPDTERFHALVEEGRVLVVEIDGIDFVPCWQFTTEGDVLDGLDELLSCFPGDRLSLAEWLTQPSAALGGHIPVLLLSWGWRQTVVDHVRKMRTG